ncbi:MAG: hypothetical protein KZQ91_11330 [Candidatus Thiodiazotropha sp. (ex Lucinoma borealis)]|nr:hypothetical protein [Candidatus Thiodiazotropha sp. (ex Lucinoma borealis)]
MGSRLVTLEAETQALTAAKLGQFVTGGFDMAANDYLKWLYSRDDIVIDNGPWGERVRTIEQVIPALGESEFSGLLVNPLTTADLSTVTGHSLVGHLSTALTRLVQGIEDQTINGAGFSTGLIPGLRGDAVLNIQNLFGMLGGASSFDSSRNLNLYGDKMPEFVTQHTIFGLMQQGGHESVFIEQSTFLGNVLGHGSSQMADSLAVYDLFIQLSDALSENTPADTLARLMPIFKAASGHADHSLETMVRSLSRLFGVNDVLPEIDDREALYVAIRDIRESVLYQQAMGVVEIVPLTETIQSDIVDLVKNDQDALAYRFALINLDPFAVTGDRELYALHNEHDELELYDPATHEGTLTETYLRDRTYHFRAIMHSNKFDFPHLTTSGDDVLFWDAEAGQLVSASDPVIEGLDWNSLVHYRFGGGGGELHGGVGNDAHIHNSSLYGEAGDDTIDSGTGRNLLVDSTYNVLLSNGMTRCRVRPTYLATRFC